MQKKNIVPIVAIVLAFVLICASLCCALIAIGTEFDLYNKIFGKQPEATQAWYANQMILGEDVFAEIPFS